MFYDETRVDLSAGKGGDGCVSFRREKYLPKGGPDGGDGGRGGHVILRCDENVGDLRQFHFQPIWKAKPGRAGSGRQMTGGFGKDAILRVPPGTLAVREGAETPEAELLTHGEEVILLNGGHGGKGNLKFKSSVNQAPRQFTHGGEGEVGHFRFVLKVIADAGLVGFPNAGKSTLVNILTRARPKTAAYPFTTLQPTVGVIEYTDRYGTLKLADIPGLTKGAHENRGLGHRFLRHIERCPVLIYLLDFRDLQDELGHYDPTLRAKPVLVAANKMDEAVAQENFARFKEAFSTPIISISALLEEGIPELKEAIWKAVKGDAR